MVFVFLALSLLQGPAASVPGPVATMECSVGAEERSRLLSLDFQAFDQAPGGWRKYADAHCNRMAATLIATYVAENKPSLRNEETLRFHEAQNLAFGDARTEAAAILDRVLALKQQRNGDKGGQLYVEATRAFLISDRKAFDTALEALRVHTSSDAPNAVLSLPNLAISEGLGRCFDKAYAQAYLPPCVEMAAVTAGHRAIEAPSAPTRP